MFIKHIKHASKPALLITYDWPPTVLSFQSMEHEILVGSKVYDDQPTRGAIVQNNA